MQVITGTREFQISEPTVVTIGKFDGRHKGHQKLLRKMQELKESMGLRIAVFTFDMAPMGVVTGHPVTVITRSVVGNWSAWVLITLWNTRLIGRSPIWTRRLL